MIDFYKHLRRIADCPSKLYKNFRVILLTFFTVNSSGIRLLRMLKASGLMLGVFFAFILLVVVIVVIVPDAREMLVTRTPSLQNDPSLKIEPFYERVIESTDKAVQSRTRKYNSLTPNQQYLVVNTTANHFFLYRGNTLIRQGFCSSGSYIQLKSNDDREWFFKTPKGMHRIQGKITSPVWRRPDWAFIEEGLPVPSYDHPSRYEAGVLGDYALSLGDGYLIHGTIYKRMLGMPVTHGCIRLNDEDLESIFKALNVGSKVYIY